jgi:hypothetical protein
VEASERLARREVNLVSWHRELPSGLDARLVEWAERFPAQFDEIVCMPHYDLSAATRGLAEPARPWLTMDVAVLIARLAHLADARRLRISFGAVRTDQCRKFHGEVHRSLPIEGTGRVRVVLIATTVDGS